MISLEIEILLSDVLEQKRLILATLSSPRQKGGISKVTIRPILLKGKSSFQITENHLQKAFHHNFTKESCFEWLKKHLGDFKQAFFYTNVGDYHLLLGKKGHFTLLKKGPTKIPRELKHNRQKDYIWEEGIPVPFLVHLGIMNSEGKVYAAKKDKFRQINRFLEMINDVLPHFNHSQRLQVVDFGCGKAYLTFALYHFLKETKGYQIAMAGLDLKSDVIAYCQGLVEKLGYQDDLQFMCGDINDFQIKGTVDMVVSLHACDTATDAALERAIRWQSQVILSVPCCQHEVMQQIQQEKLLPLMKHGIVKERFAALVTDAARAQLLEVLGYQTQILEFIDVEHTPKNLLIRAIRRSQSQLEAHQQLAWRTYCEFKKTLHIFPSLEKRFQWELRYLN